MENSQIHYLRPNLYPKQTEAIFHGQRYGFIEGSTKCGKTYGLMSWLLEQAITGPPGANYYWVAPVFPQAEIVFKRYKASLPAEMYRKNDTDRIITLNHAETVLHFKSGEKPDNLYGDDVSAAVIDEASRCREESYHAVRSTLTATRGPLRCIGNVKGRKNWFYALSRRAEMGERDMHYAKLTALDAIGGGVLAQDEIDDAKRLLPEAVFRELYMAEPADDGGNPFGLAAIGDCVQPALMLSPNPIVAWGWDLAKSVDFTVGIGLDAFGNVVAFHRWQGVPWQETIRRIREITGIIPAFVDSTGVGDAILEGLQEGRMNFEGYVFSQTSKQRLMEGLAVAIQSKAISYPDGVIRQELELFEYEYTRTGVRYTAPEGFHDDCVCALALANRRLTTPLPGMGLLAAMKAQVERAQGAKNG